MISFCWKYIRKAKVVLGIYTVLIIFEGAINIVIPILTGKIIDVIGQLRDLDLLILLCCIYLGIQIFVKISNFFSFYSLMRLQTFCAFELNENVIKHIQNLSISEVEKFDYGYLSQRVNNDSNTVITLTITLLTQLPINILIMLIIVAMLLYIDMGISFFLIVIAIIYFFLYLGFRKKVYNMSYVYKERQNKFFSILLEQLEKVKFIKLHSLVDIYNDKLKKEFKAFWNDTKKTQLFFFLYSNMYSCIMIVSQIIVYFWGGIQVIQGNITIGTLILIIGFFQSILKSITYISDFTKQYQDGKVSYYRLMEILEMQEENNGSLVLDNIEKLECNDLLVTRGENKTVENLTCTFRKGELYCIVGKNGSGKTTLVEALVGLFIDEYKGEIKLNDIEIRRVDMKKMRYKKISILEQIPQLIADNIYENIFITDMHKCENVNNYIKEGIFIKGKKIFDKEKKISGLSGGEIQKVALLRTLSKKADIYIFDEGNSALDTKGKKIFSQVLQEIKKNSIVLVVSHDEAFINISDHIVDLDNNNIF